MWSKKYCRRKRSVKLLKRRISDTTDLPTLSHIVTSLILVDNSVCCNKTSLLNTKTIVLVRQQWIKLIYYLRTDSGQLTDECYWVLPQHLCDYMNDVAPVN